MFDPIILCPNPPLNSDLKSFYRQQVVSKPHSKVVEMPKRGGSSANDSCTTIQEVMPRIEVVTSSIFSRTSTYYRLWAMRMEVYLEAHGLWEVITKIETNINKDWQALLAILNSISKSVRFQLDVKKTAKENW